MYQVLGSGYLEQRWLDGLIGPSLRCGKSFGAENSGQREDLKFLFLTGLMALIQCLHSVLQLCSGRSAYCHFVVCQHSAQEIAMSVFG